MSTTLLATKLYVPPTGPGLVPRTRLVDRLNQGLDRGSKLTLVSAPAGFGKTTLLSDWASKLGRDRVGWISLDDGDNDPARFLAYVVGALKTAGASVDDATLGLLRSPQPPPLETVLTVLINQIAAARPRDPGDHPLVLVLDDYHLITTPAIHRAITFLLDHAPPRLHLALSTRADPPFPMARLRGRGQLTELRTADLRFTAAEAAIFLQGTMGLDLSPQDVAALEARTEGWITGLQLSALAMVRSTGAVPTPSPGTRIPDDGPPTADGQRTSRDTFIQEFANSNRYVLDFLGEEVFSLHGEDVQSFLLQTSILDRLTGSLCDAVTGRDDGAAVLEQLERANMFLVPLDRDRRWFRYHRLFADALRHRLQRFPLSGKDHGESIAVLHRKAAHWHEQHGFTTDAVNHWLAADAFSEAACLVQDNALSLLACGELFTLLSWIGKLPEDLVDSHPHLGIYDAWAHLLTGQLEAVEPRLRRAEKTLEAVKAGTAQGEALETAELGDALGHIAAIRAYAATFSGDPNRVASAAQEALQLLAPDNLFLRSILAFLLGGACLLRNDVAGAVRAFGESATLGQQVGNIHLVLPAMCALASLEEAQGNLHRARDIYWDALRVATDQQGRVSPVSAGAWVGLGELAYEWNDLESAERYLEGGVALAKQWGNVETIVNGQVVLARLRAAQQDGGVALSLLAEAEASLRRQATMPGTDAAFAACRMQMYIQESRLAAAARYAAERNLSADDDLNLVQELEHIALARILIAQNDPQALSLLARLLAFAEEGGRVGRLVPVLNLKALAHRKLATHPGPGQGDKLTQALSALDRALSLAEAEGYTRIFLDEGPPMAGLLREAASHGFGRDYVKHLLDAFDAESQHPSAILKKKTADTTSLAAADAALVEPLSERELEVLRLIADGLTNQQIADELVIALGTVKAHTSNIYGKLDVRSRTQAVARATELGLL